MRSAMAVILLVPLDLVRDQHEFVTAEPCDGVLGAQDREKLGSDVPQERVADVMAEPVVHELEMVDIEEHHGALKLPSLRTGHRPLETIAQKVPIRQPRQRVVIDVVLELLLMSPGLGDVVQNADKVSDVAAGVAHGRNAQLVPEERPVLAIVAQRDAAFFLFEQQRAKGGEPGLVNLLAMQETAVFPDHLRGAVAGDALERRIHVHDRILLPPPRRDDDRVHGGFDGPLVQPHLLLGGHAFGHIAEIDGKTVPMRIYLHLVPDAEAQRILQILDFAPFGHRLLQLPVTRRAQSFGEEIPAVATDQAARTHPKDLLGLRIEVREPPLPIHRDERIADAFEDLGGIEGAVERDYRRPRSRQGTHGPSVKGGRFKAAESRWNISFLQCFAAQTGSTGEPARAALVKRSTARPAQTAVAAAPDSTWV